LCCLDRDIHFLASVQLEEDRASECKMASTSSSNEIFYAAGGGRGGDEQPPNEKKKPDKKYDDPIDSDSDSDSDDSYTPSEAEELNRQEQTIKEYEKESRTLDKEIAVARRKAAADRVAERGARQLHGRLRELHVCYIHQNSAIQYVSTLPMENAYIFYSSKKSSG